MRYFNNSDIKQYQGTFDFSEHYIMNASESRDGRISVFLSHSSKDENKLPSVVNFLEKFGVNVYVDKNDNGLPRKTSPETGTKLKERIYKCDKFIVLISENSKDSKWIPWELGIADVEKTLRNIALLPSVASLEKPDWAKQEYMGLYDRITYGGHKNYNGDIWMVHNHFQNTATELGKWIRQ